MVVWRGDHAYYRKHTMDISEKDATEMENALKKVGEEKFGKGEFFIDKVQRQVLDHLHWHARPKYSDWVPTAYVKLQ